jgi:hypothetical protein
MTSRSSILPLSPAGQVARDILLADQKLLRDAGLEPSLDLIPAYPRDPESGPVPIDVYDFHADSANTLADTFLCSYTVASSEGVANREAICRVDIPETRAELLKLYGGADDAGFIAWCNAHCYDLHYAASAPRPALQLRLRQYVAHRHSMPRQPRAPVHPSRTRHQSRSGTTIVAHQLVVNPAHQRPPIREPLMNTNRH